MPGIDVLQGYAANVAVLVLIAGMVRWMFARIDRYQDRMESRFKEVEDDGKKCRERSIALLSAYQLTAGALRRRDPHAPELDMADHILSQAFNIEPLPPEFEALVGRIK